MNPPRQLIVIGASAGGIDALRTVVAALPDDFRAPICIVLHTSPNAPGILHEILGRGTALTVVQPNNRERLREGYVYVAPPDHHLLVEPGILRVTRGPRENRFRPAIDPLFRSAAQVYGPGAIGVILTGGLDDGTDGLWAIKRLGGRAIVQDPTEAEAPSMPGHAIAHVDVDHVVGLGQIAPLLVQLTTGGVSVEAGGSPSKSLKVEVKVAMEQNALEAGLTSIGVPSAYTCPECHGVLLEISDGGTLPKFRCHTGHAYSISSLVAAISEGIESSMWEAVRALEEGQMIMTRLAEHYAAAHGAADVRELISRSEEARARGEALRALITESSSRDVSARDEG